MKNDNDAQENAPGRRERGRVFGGTGWADAVFRAQADTASYVRELFRRVEIRKGPEGSGARLLQDGQGLVFVSPGQPPVFLENGPVESMRCQDVHQFEQWMDSVLAQNRS